ncbi:MazG nucleotide pyrophosphohydrolase domain-containing protein [Arthrobacter sp. CAN_A214]|uniref:MazG nucleotide pyrophosphohydrolase domain-containing protein n=1 Tax=Arthrobacter sp. CAN_A214 TaxID=2787720 RepID=UPI003FA41604
MVDRTGPSPQPGPALDRLLTVIGQLRQYCPWTAALTPTSLRQYLVEECYELLDAVEQVEEAEQAAQQVPPAYGKQTSLLDELRGELGDVLFQVVLHAELQHERGTFGLGAVVEGLTAKLVRRNPHVFRADGSVQEHFPATIREIVATWQAVKVTEKPDRRPFDGIPNHLPALALAAKSLSRAASLGAAPPVLPADQQDVQPADEPVPPADQPADLPVLSADQQDVRTAEEFGDQLLALAAAAVGQGIDPELALRSAVHRFQDRAAGAS